MSRLRPLLVLAFAFTFGLGLATGCGAPAPLEGWNVVVVVIDSLRASHLGTYGYARPTTPNIDALAREAVVFERATSASSYTRESIASLFTGRLPSRSGAIGWGARPPADAETLASLFQRSGYRTAMVSNSIMLRHAAFQRGFDESRFVGRSQMVSGGGPALVDAALDFAGADFGRPFFLYLHFLDPHGPYDPPAELRQRMGGEAPPRPLSLYGDVRDRCSELAADGFGPGDPRFDDLVARYDAEIVHTDAALARLFAGLRAAGSLDRTLVVLTADHGEEFLEHDFVEHAWTVYQESIHVPLVVWAGSAVRPERVAGRVSLVDLMPTLVDALGLDAPDQPMDGQPLFVSSSGSAPALAVAERSGPVYAELMVQSRNLVRSVTDGRWKYIAVLHWMEPGEREAAVRARRVNQTPRGAAERDPFGPVIREELYDLEADPGETRSLVRSEPETLARMRRLLQDAFAVDAHTAGARGPMELEDLSDADRSQLEALGYLGADDAPPTSGEER